MSEPPATPGGKMTGLEHRAQAAVSAVRRAVSVEPPDLARLRTHRRVTALSALGLLAALVVAVLVVADAATPALPGLTAAILGALVLGTFALGIHAGGHGWFVPLPAAALAAGWAVVASSGRWAGALAWLLAAGAVVACLAAAAAVVPALAVRHLAATHGDPAALRGAEGVAVTDLAPESGPLPAGTPVRVVSLSGLRLQVWSEAGTVPGPEALDRPKEHP
jgi:hypothetical protein